MTGGRGTGGLNRRDAFTRAVLLFFFLRCLVPPGFMPIIGGSGGIEVVVCTGAGLKTVILDSDGNPVSPDDSQSGNADACPFATVAAGVFLLPDAQPEAAIRAPARHSVADPGHPVLKPPAQGPPLGPRAPPAILV